VYLGRKRAVGASFGFNPVGGGKWLGVQGGRGLKKKKNESLWEVGNVGGESSANRGTDWSGHRIHLTNATEQTRNIFSEGKKKDEIRRQSGMLFNTRELKS